jgi:hypothetical protein
VRYGAMLHFQVYSFPSFKEVKMVSFSLAAHGWLNFLKTSEISNDYRSRTNTLTLFRIVQKEGNHFIKRNIDFFNLDVIISIGYRVKSKRRIEVMEKKDWQTTRL